MKDFFIDIFQYHHHYNQQLLNLLIAHEDNLTERSIPLFSHSINAHQIWNARIIGTPTIGVNDVHTLAKCKLLDNSNFKDTLTILDRYELDATIAYQNSKGVKYENTVRDILFHTANHFTHHRGQVISDLRQQGIEPMVTDYIFYKR